ncbi:hypothetical protein CVT25_009103 [Psilocybe cyanescens]|uniref:Uncharacterized protein n=1 Tax=Psilocybe cyanescens TaxID=93625 RepID=A0A409VNJ2_PSICY|nr:hypothetical protein CVT25_009103 [Psilocybe cyanescens]
MVIMTSDFVDITIACAFLAQTRHLQSIHLTMTIHLWKDRLNITLVVLMTCFTAVKVVLSSLDSTYDSLSRRNTLDAMFHIYIALYLFITIDITLSAALLRRKLGLAGALGHDQIIYVLCRTISPFLISQAVFRLVYEIITSLPPQKTEKVNLSALIASMASFYFAFGAIILAYIPNLVCGLTWHVMERRDEEEPSRFTTEGESGKEGGSSEEGGPGKEDRSGKEGGNSESESEDKGNLVAFFQSWAWATFGIGFVAEFFTVPSGMMIMTNDLADISIACAFLVLVHHRQRIHFPNTIPTWKVALDIILIMLMVVFTAIKTTLGSNVATYESLTKYNILNAMFHVYVALYVLATIDITVSATLLQRKLSLESDKDDQLIYNLCYRICLFLVPQAIFRLCYEIIVSLPESQTENVNFDALNFVDTLVKGVAYTFTLLYGLRNFFPGKPLISCQPAN